MQFRESVMRLGQLVFATDSGLCRLESFDEVELEFGIKSLMAQKYIEKPFIWLVQLMMNHAEMRGVKPNWRHGWSYATERSLDATHIMYYPGYPWKEFVIGL